MTEYLKIRLDIHNAPFSKQIEFFKMFLSKEDRNPIPAGPNPIKHIS